MSSHAPTIGWRSGRRSASIGVGTVTMKKLAWARSSARLVRMQLGLAQLVRGHLARAVAALAQLADAPLGDVEPRTGAKCLASASATGRPT